MAPKILIVLTSQDKFLDKNDEPIPDKSTGWYLPEFAHPYFVLKDKADLTIASPNGGHAPLDGGSVGPFLGDPLCKEFHEKYQNLWNNTVRLSEVSADDFDAVFYVGGHGPMFDLVKDQTSIDLINAFDKAQKPISAVCHGPVVFIHADSSGKPLLSGTKVTGFSNVEEDQAQLSSFMPFMLEDELNRVSVGGYIKANQPWGEQVVESKTAGGATLITGQNPASAAGVGKAILSALGIEA